MAAWGRASREARGAGLLVVVVVPVLFFVPLSFADPDLFDPRREVFPLLVGGTVGGPEDDLAFAVHAVVVAVVLADWQQPARDLHLLPGRLADAAQVGVRLR